MHDRRTLKERILDLVDRKAGHTDREITELEIGRGEPQQAVNQACRELERGGKIARRKRPDGLIGNFQHDSFPPDSPASPQRTRKNAVDDSDLSEDEVKAFLVAWLEKDGWAVDVAWGRSPGIDIVAHRAQECRVIEVKGCGSRPAMRVNYFLAVIGELLQRMSDPSAHYSIALPDRQQFRRLWGSFPVLAKQRLGISAIFVAADGRVSVCEPESPVK